MNLSEGHIIADHYKLLRQLGHGSFGDVWLAHNMLADIDVAIKFYGTLDQKGLEGFRNEFKIAYKLNHPNLLSINHFDVYESCPYLVMPYCANGSASKYIGNISEPELWKFIHDVASGLAFLHEQHPPIVHQDIKPDNILITAEGRYVISDFGISRSFRTMMSRTNNMNSSGTLAYMGPERFSEKPMMVLASDIWALGMTLFELMTGDVLWGGTGGCVQLNGARIPANDGRWSQQLYQLVTSCLAKETWERPTAVQLSQIAADHLQGKTDWTISSQPTYTQQSVDTVAPRTYTPSHDYSSGSSPRNYSSDSSPRTNYYHSTGKESEHKKTNEYKEDFSLKYFIFFAIACLAVFLIVMGIIFWKDDDKPPVTSTPPATEVQQPPAALQQPVAPAVPEATTTDVQEKVQPRAKSQKSKTAKKKKEPVLPASQRIEQTQTFTGTAPVYVQQPSSGNTEDDKAFRNCKTPADYSLYLSKYPNGKHRREAQSAIKAVNREYERINSQLPADKRRKHKSLNPR
jgi:serine/threonine protein kinase